MSTTRKFFQDLDLRSENTVSNAKSVQISQNAIQADQAVRKDQCETIADQAVQDGIVQSGSESDRTLSAQAVQTALATKQPNMSVHPSSTAFLEIVNGSEIRLKDLGIITNHVDNASANLTQFVASLTYNGNNTVTTQDSQILDANTLVFLALADNPSERSFVYLGTNNGDETDFVAFSVDYNTATIRTYFSAAGVGLDYDSATGIFSLVLGNGVGALGSHSLPMDSTKFSTISASNASDALVQLEDYIEQVDAAATGGQVTLDNRLTSLSGVSGNNLGAFIENLFSANQTIKYVLQEAETKLREALDDRAAIRAEFAAGDFSLQQSINLLGNSMGSADSQLQANINAEANSRSAADSLLQQNIDNEESARIAEDLALCQRLDVIEGSGAGSVAKAQSDAQAYADAQVLVEKNRALAAEAALDTKIDNLQEGDITYIGSIDGAGILSVRTERINAVQDTRNGQALKDVALRAGEEFVVSADQTLVFNDSSQLALENGDKMMALDDVTAGAATAAVFNVVQANGSALSVNNLDSVRIYKNLNNKLDVVDNSIGRQQLSPSVESDIDDARSSTQANAITSDGDTHFVSSSALGAQQNMYWKRDQIGNAPLSDTCRTLLAELDVHSDGSGISGVASYAHTVTMSSHYKGNCQDPSQVVMAGGNFEANAKAGTAIQATGIYALATQPQNGVNVGVTAVANGAATSNLGSFSFAGTAGVGNDRGLVAAVSSLDLLAYSGTRLLDPFPHADIVITADAKYAPAGTKAIYSYGDVRFDSGVVEVEDAPSTDKGVMRLKDVKDKEAIFQMDLVNGVEKTVPCSLDLNKALIQVIDNDEQIEVSVVRDVTNSQLKVTAIGSDLTAVRVLVKELECDVTVVP